MTTLVLHTPRLTLRPWRDDDAASLYGYARNPAVGPIAGWPVHTSVEHSREVIRDVLAVDGTWAVTLRDDDAAIGSIGLMTGDASNLALPDGEAEIGYWIGEPLWGRGLIPEATREVMRHAFRDLGIATLWCGYFDGNDKSRRVGEKCGFRFVRSERVFWPSIDRTVTQHITRLTRDEYLKTL